MKTSSEIWSSLAKLYADKFMHLKLYDDTYRRLCALLKPNASLLELGCGPGNITRQLIINRPDLNILATDYAVGMVEFTKKNNPTIQTQILDAKNLDDLHQLFDGIVAGFILPYLTKIETDKFLSDCYNALSAEGTLYLSFDEGDHSESKLITGSTGDALFFHYYSILQIRELLKTNEFEILEEISIPFERSKDQIENHIVILAKKV